LQHDGEDGALTRRPQTPRGARPCRDVGEPGADPARTGGRAASGRRRWMSGFGGVGGPVGLAAPGATADLGLGGVEGVLADQGLVSGLLGLDPAVGVVAAMSCADAVPRSHYHLRLTRPDRSSA
jgi:hypothetical protein